MNLSNSNCVELSVECVVPYNSHIWQRMVAFFENKEEAVKRRGTRVVAIGTSLKSSEKSADFHYHFFAKKVEGKKGKTIQFTVSLHKNVQLTKGKDLTINQTELWLLGLLGQKYEGRSLDFEVSVRFHYRKPRFVSVLPIPFKSPFDIPDGKRLLGDVSISGLKFRLENSEVGIKTIYCETFESSIRVRTIFSQRAILSSGVLEQFLSNAEKISVLFVKEEGENVGA